MAGSAIHEITEALDLDSLGRWGKDIPVFKEVFDQFLAKEEDRGIEVKASGRKLKSIGKGGGPNKKDYNWWLEYGPPMIERYRQWRQDSGYSIAVMPDGEPGIEIAINVDFAGERQLGFIDRIFIDQDYQPVIVDLKTGNVPQSIIQLGVYRVGIMRKYDLDIRQGSYWMGGDGELTGIVDLSHFSPDYMDNLFGMAWKGIRAGVFLPNVSNMCAGCPVRDSCRAVGGNVSITVPLIETVTPRQDARSTELTNT